MALTPDLRRSALDLGYVLAGVADVAAEQAKGLHERARSRREEILTRDYAGEARAVAERLQGAPAVVVARGLEVASRTQVVVDDLGSRGRRLVERAQGHEGGDDVAERAGEAADAAG
ncbi:hypothetical protein, partial [Pseudokineococcus marinus]